MEGGRVPEDSKTRKEKRKESVMGWWDERMNLNEQCCWVKEMRYYMKWNGDFWDGDWGKLNLVASLNLLSKVMGSFTMKHFTYIYTYVRRRKNRMKMKREEVERDSVSTFQPRGVEQV